MVILFDQFHLSENIFEVVFATEQQVVVANLLVDEMKRHGNSIGKTEMSLFATRLHDGVTVTVNEQVGPVTKRKQTKVSYNKRQFYDRILTPMKSMGMIDYDLYKKHYTLSDKFQKVLSNIALLWVSELRKPARME